MATYEAINADNWTRIRGKVVDKQLRKLIPARKEIFDNKGNLKISKDIYDALVESIEARRTDPTHKPVRDAKTGRFKKQKGELAIDSMLSAMREEPSLSPDERALIATAQIVVLRADAGQHVSLNTTMKETGAIRNKAWYEAKFHVEDGDFDYDKASDEQIEDIARGMLDGTIDTTNLTEEDIDKINKRVWGGDGEQEQGGAITPRVTPREQEIRGILSALRMGQDIAGF